jgi:hypothetical protein
MGLVELSSSSVTGNLRQPEAETVSSRGMGDEGVPTVGSIYLQHHIEQSEEECPGP